MYYQSMNTELLQELGLNKSQATIYLKLIEKGELSPPRVATLTGESRSNAYMVLQRLEEMGLVEKAEKNKKVYYQAMNPIALEQLAQDRREETARVENQVKHAMPQMLSYFYSFTEKPGIRLLQGIDGLKEIYSDTLRTREDIYFLRTPSEVKTLGSEYFDRYKKRRADLGITTYAFTQDTPKARQHALDDEVNKMIRTWIDPESYEAPVEVNVYGDKVAFLAYGDDIMGVIIQNRPIAEAMRQTMRMMAVK